MTEPTPRPPGSEYADALRDVVEHAARADAPRPPTEPRAPLLTRPPVLALLAVGFFSVVAWDVRMMRIETPPSTPAREEMARGLSVLAVGHAVEAYRNAHGSLPESLDDVGFPSEEYEYIREGDRFEVRPREAGTGAAYDSRAPVEAFVRQLVPPEEVR